MEETPYQGVCSNSSVSSIYSLLSLFSALRSSYLPHGTHSQTPFCQLPCSHELIFRSLHHRALTFPSNLSPSLAYKHLGDYIFLIPRWFGGKESACQCRRRRFDPCIGKIPWRRKWQLTLGFFPGEFHGQRSWWTTVCGATKGQARLSI